MKIFRVLGLAGVAVTVLLVLRDALGEEEQVQPTPIEPPPHAGFPIPLADLGEVELTLLGASGWTVYDDVEQEDGRIARRARWKVTGMDPTPDGEGFGVTEAVMESLREDRDGFVLRTPYLWIPTVEGPSGPLPDREKRWRLAAPVIEVREMFEGRGARIVSESAELDPTDDRIYGSGKFTLTSGSLELVGSALRFDPRTRRADFAPWQGAVSWRLLQPGAGGEVRGKSDGGGFLEPVGEDQARVRMDAAEEVTTLLPDSGELRTRDLDLLLAAGADGSWVPQRADASAPTRWQDASRLLIGRASTLDFDRQGQPSSLEVRGPLRLFPGDGSLDWATARGGAWFDPRAESVYLHGGFGAQRGRNTVQGGWARLVDGRIRAGGGIWALGEQGSARAERLRELADGRWVAEEDARFYPADPQLREVVAPRIFFDQDGAFEVLDGFVARGVQEGRPASFRGAELRSRMHGESRRTHADGGLVLEREGVRLEAERMRQVGPEQIQLFGRPMVGRLTLDQGGEADLHCGRADWSSGVLTLRRDPLLAVPAAALGLRGERVTLAAEDMTRGVDGSWKLVERVSFAGDLQGSSDEASWAPEQYVELIGWSTVASLAGTRLDGIAFHAEALKLRVEAPGTFLLDGRAEVRLRRPEDEADSVLRGARVAGDLDRATASGGASFETPEGDGSAHSIEWRRVAEERYDFQLVGDARLQRQGMEARGDRIDFEAESGDLIVHGSVDRHARIQLADGRTATGTLLRYNERLQTFSGGDIRLTSP